MQLVDTLRAERDGVQKALIAIGLTHAAAYHPELLALIDDYTRRIRELSDSVGGL